MKYSIAARVRGVLLGGIAVLASAGLLIAPTTTSASIVQKAKSCRTANGIKITDAEVCKGLAYYKGKTLTYVEVGSVGGAFDEQADAEIPSLQSYLGATFVGSRYPTGNTIPGQDFLASAVPNGLTIGLLNPLNDASQVVEKVPGINFNPDRMAYLAGIASSAATLVALPSSGITTFSQFMKGIRAGTVRIAEQNSGSVNTVLRALMAAVGGITNPNSTEWVTGYTSEALQVTGLLRGDAPTADLNLDEVCNLLQGNKVVPLATNIVPPVGTNCRKYLTSVPTFVDLAKTYAKTKAQKSLFKTTETLNALTGFPTVTQTGVAGYKVDALRAALQWTYQQSFFKTTLLADGIDPAYVNPVKAKQEYETGVTLAKTIVCYENSSIACSKA